MRLTGMSQPGCAPRDAIDQIEISSPCSESWAEMRRTPGEEWVRFCGKCRQNVYNVEAMSRGRARQLIAAREGNVCVRILRRPDGTVVTADCWARLRAARRRGWLPFLGMLVLVGFTELIAIGVGLARLKGLFVAPLAPPAHVSLPVLSEAVPRAVPAIVTSPPHIETGPPPPTAHRLMGKRAASRPPKQTHFMGAPARKPNVDDQPFDMGLVGF
jgi:hypothetical protein